MLTKKQKTFFDPFLYVLNIRMWAHTHQINLRLTSMEGYSPRFTPSFSTDTNNLNSVLASRSKAFKGVRSVNTHDSGSQA